MTDGLDAAFGVGVTKSDQAFDLVTFASQRLRRVILDGLDGRAQTVGLLAIAATFAVHTAIMQTSIGVRDLLVTLGALAHDSNFRRIESA